MAKAHGRGSRGVRRGPAGAGLGAAVPGAAGWASGPQQALLAAFGGKLELEAHAAGVRLAEALLEWLQASGGHTVAALAAMVADAARGEGVLGLVRALNAAARERGFAVTDGVLGCPRSVAYLQALEGADAVVAAVRAADPDVAWWTATLVERYAATCAYVGLLVDLGAAARAE